MKGTFYKTCAQIAMIALAVLVVVFGFYVYSR